MSSRTIGRKAGQRPGTRRDIYKTGLCEGTHVMTTVGNMPVEFLMAGDRVMTSNGPQVLHHIAARLLTDCPIEIRRGSLGHGRPQRDMFLAPDQAIHLSDWRGQRYYGSDQPSVPVSRLQDGEHIIWGEHPGEMLVFDLELSEQHVIYADGMEVISAALPETITSVAAE